MLTERKPVVAGLPIKVECKVKKKKNQFIKGIIKVDSYVPLFG